MGWIRLPVSWPVWVRARRGLVQTREIAAGPDEPPQLRCPQWLMIRVCSASSVRNQTARSGTTSPIILLTDQRDRQLAEEWGVPVVPIRQHQDLPVVPDLEQLLGAPVQRPHHDLGPVITPWSVHSRSSSSPALLG